MTKALALFSGGLDSILAVRVLQEQNIDIEAIHFTSAFAADEASPGEAPAVKGAAERLGVPLRLEDNSAELLAIVRSPRYGYGRNLNPCIDCRIRSVKRAGQIMREVGADFLITGEVVGERPMSQNRQSLRTIDRQSGLDGLILRPLSAQLLDATIPEQEGRVDRDRLLALAGRSRKPQLELAAKYGIREFPSPAGGCLLTDPGFSARMRDLLERDPDCDVNDVRLLKVGRHFRIAPEAKVVVGRNHEENGRILSLSRKGDLLMEAAAHPGPVTLLRGAGTEENVALAAALTVRYGKAGSLPRAQVRTWASGGARGSGRSLEAAPASDELVSDLMIAAAGKKGGGRRGAE